MNTPSTAEITTASKLEAFTSGTAADRDRWVASGKASWRRFTGRTFDMIDADDAPLVINAVRGLSELAALDQSADRQETLADFDLIKSFGAGSYNETRRDADEARKARALVAWPWLNTLLWDFMTPEMHEKWTDFFLDPAAVPAAGVTEVDWTRGLASGSDPLGGDSVWDAGGLRDDGYDYLPGT